jgi:DNA processing protein
MSGIDGCGEELGALLRLVMLSDCGPRRLRGLLDGRTPIEAVSILSQRRFEVLRPALTGCRGVDLPLIERWARQVEGLDGDELLERHRRSGIHVEGPDLLASGEPWVSDPEPPMVLFRRGEPVDLSVPRVAVVGTRRCTAYGRAVARELVSGGAAGIDGEAQRAALDAGGRVVGVVGSGLDQVYPRSNAGLWHRLGEESTLLSEYPLGVEPARWRFPARNRLIAALSDLVVVVESADRGGSLYTVDAALERGRAVAAVPGPVTSVTSAGPNRLLVDGAFPVRGVPDVVCLLGCPPAPAGSDGGSAVGHPADAAVAWLLDALGWEAATVDELVLRTGRGLAAVTAALGELRATGAVNEIGGWWERLR